MRKVMILMIVFLCAMPISLVGASSSMPSSRLVEKEVEYTSGDINLKGFFVYDSKIEGRRPGVIVVHEWWGHNDYARKRARQLAKMGYAAFALDMFGDGKTADHPDQAKGFIEEIMKDLRGVGQDRFMAALEAMKAEPEVDPGKIAAIGYCFGGGVVLQMARYGVDLKGIISFHGGLKALGPTPKDRVKGEILVFNGADDPFVTAKQIDEFMMDMEAAEVKHEFVNYEGVKHSFTNPEATKLGKKFDMPLKYNRKADKDSWMKTGAFLKRIFSE